MTTSLHCSFCGKADHEIAKLVDGPGGVHICDECVATCHVIMEAKAPHLSSVFDATLWPKDRLLALLGPVNSAAEAHRQHLQQIVETLRTHDVSWATIADALGVTRQTAWERFS